MMEARTNAVFQAVFGRYTDWLVRRSFAAVHAKGTSALSVRPWPPTIIAVNHSAWWDPIVVLWLTRRFGVPGTFFPMDAANLRRYRFFQRLGAFGVERASAARAVGVSRYVSKTLTADRTLWISPQGRQMPNDARPLNFERGAAAWAKAVPGCRLIPAAACYEFLEEQRPEIFLHFGDAVPTAGTTREINAALEDAVTRLLNDLRAGIAAEYWDGFETISRGSRSLGERWK